MPFTRGLRVTSEASQGEAMTINQTPASTSDARKRKAERDEDHGDQGLVVRAADLLPVPVLDDDTIERARAVARKAVADEFYAMQGGDPEWVESPEPNAGDDSIGNAVVHALAAANLLVSPVREPGRSEAEIKAEALREYADARYGAYLEDPDVSWVDQPSQMAQQYAKAREDLHAAATRIAAQVSTTEGTD